MNDPRIIHEAFVDLFTAQHAHLIKLTEQLEKHVLKQSPLEAILELIYGIAALIDIHFRSEEEMMKLLQYYKLPEHVEAHNDLRTSLHAQILDIKNNPSIPTLSLAIVQTKLRINQHMHSMDIMHELYKPGNYRYSGENLDALLVDIYNRTNSFEHESIEYLIDLLKLTFETEEEHTYINTLLYELIAKQKLHFSHEEKIMRKYSFPKYEEHYKDHMELLKLAQEVKYNFEQNNYEECDSDVFEMMQECLQEHILKQDRDYRDFYASLNI